jgi:adenylyl- and sulfurtransferase ThiI
VAVLPIAVIDAVAVTTLVASTTVTELDVIDAVADTVALPPLVANPETVILELTLTRLDAFLTLVESAEIVELTLT